MVSGVYYWGSGTDPIGIRFRFWLDQNQNQYQESGRGFWQKQKLETISVSVETRCNEQKVPKRLQRLVPVQWNFTARFQPRRSLVDLNQRFERLNSLKTKPDQNQDPGPWTWPSSDLVLVLTWCWFYWVSAYLINQTQPEPDWPVERKNSPLTGRNLHQNRTQNQNQAQKQQPSDTTNRRSEKTEQTWTRRTFYVIRADRQ